MMRQVRCVRSKTPVLTVPPWSLGMTGLTTDCATPAAKPNAKLLSPIGKSTSMLSANVGGSPARGIAAARLEADPVDERHVDGKGEAGDPRSTIER